MQNQLGLYLSFTIVPIFSILLLDPSQNCFLSPPLFFCQYSFYFFIFYLRTSVASGNNICPYTKGWSGLMYSTKLSNHYSMYYCCTINKLLMLYFHLIQMEEVGSDFRKGLLDIRVSSLNYCVKIPFLCYGSR